MKILKAGLIYFALVFGAGFVLGAIRTLWLVPLLGPRAAELIEAPIMLVVTILSARSIVQRLSVPPMVSTRLAMGGLALALLLVLESSLVLWLRDLSISEYFANRDPVSGTVYYVMLLLFAMMPVFFSRSELQASKLFKSTPVA